MLIDIEQVKRGMYAHYAIIKDTDKAYVDNVKDIIIMLANDLISADDAAMLRQYNDDILSKKRSSK